MCIYHIFNYNQFIEFLRFKMNILNNMRKQQHSEYTLNGEKILNKNIANATGSATHIKGNIDI